MIKRKHNPDPFFIGTFEEKLYENLKPIQSNYIEGVGFRDRSRDCLRCGLPFKTRFNFVCEKCKHHFAKHNYSDGQYEN